MIPYITIIDCFLQKIFGNNKEISKGRNIQPYRSNQKKSRSVCANFAEAFRRRKYPAHFQSKLTVSDAENSETGVWLDFSFACKYLTESEFTELKTDHSEVGRLLGDIIKNPAKYI